MHSIQHRISIYSKDKPYTHIREHRSMFEWPESGSM